jgi:hypothetical protein
MNIEGKRLLLFAPKFFGYEQHIVEHLKGRGAIVDYYDERPSNKIIVKALIRYFPILVRPLTKRYYMSIAREVKERGYDYVLVINIETMGRIIARRLRRGFPEATMILVLWDPIYYKPNAKKILKRFDKVFSFDESDCEKYRQIHFLPDFYLKEYADITDKHNYEYDLCFIGTAHTDRYRIVKNITKAAQAKKLKVFVRLYFYSPFNYYLCRLFHKDFAGSKKKDFSFQPMTAAEIADIYGKSRIVIDIESPNQKGITMRTLEIMAAKRKMITTNDNVRNYDFFNSQNILIINKHNPVIDDTFLQSEYVDISAEIYEKYSLKSWIDYIISK